MGVYAVRRWLIIAALCVATPAMGYWHSVLQVSIGGSSYVGPGDAVAGAAAAWSTRCYTSAYTGSVIDVYSAADASHTLVTCSAGGVLNETLQSLAITCAVSCTVKTIYDQTGNGHDMGQATSGNRATFTASLLNGKYGMTCNGTTTTYNSNSITAVQPVTESIVYKKNVIHNGILIGGGGNFGLYTIGVNNVQLYAGNSVNATAADSTPHSVQALISGTSSVVKIDAAADVTGDGGTNSLTGTFNLCGGGGYFIGGDLFEALVYTSNIGATNRGLLYANQHPYWGF